MSVFGWSGDWPLRAGAGGGFSCEWAFRSTSKILFGNVVWLLLMWLLVKYECSVILITCLWKLITSSVKSRGNFWHNVVLLHSERPFLFMNRWSHPRLALNSLSDMLWDFASSRARSCSMSCVTAMLSFLILQNKLEVHPLERDIFQLSDYEMPYCHFLYFLALLFVSSNNARWIQEFRILFLLHSSRTLPRNLSLLICTTLYKHYSFSHLEILTQAHTRIVEKQLKYLRYIAVQSCLQWPKEQQPLIFKDKHQCWSTVFRI